ncbi:MAG: heparinase II/III-family protein [Lachnospiraceae bacterium]|nr:heparinase II/III-family protein [Lachnospiraceae bacterium]
MEKIVSGLIENYSGSFNTPDLSWIFEKEKTSLTKGSRSKLISNAEERLTFEFKSLSAGLFMSFKRTGNRTDYENIYFEKRRALNDLVLGELSEKKGRFTDAVIDGIFSLCEETTWCLPAHNTYVRDTPQIILADIQNPVLDLFACETGALLAAAGFLLKDELDSVSELIYKRIQHELRVRVMIPYLNCHFWWMGHGDEPMCNWTIWCTQNILLTASFMQLESSELEPVAKKAASGCDHFLKDYKEDGCCDEGAQYYRHAGLCLYLTFYLLNEICNKAFESLWNNEKIRNIAEYICNVHVNDIYYINYADCSPVAGRAGVREYLFGKALKSERLMSFACEEYKKAADPLIRDEINLTYRLLAVLYGNELLSYKSDHKESYPSCVFYESVGLFIAKTSDLCLSVKAGCNGDNHNHNDTGSIILYRYGKPVLIDVGVESYTAKTFSEDRYEIWTMQSGYHNLPTINGKDQCAGREYCANNVSVDKENLSISMDIAEAYPKDSNLLSYLRRAALIPLSTGSLIRLEDKAVFKDAFKDNSLILNLLSYEMPLYDNGILKIGDICSFSVPFLSKCEIETIPVTDPRLKKTWKHDIYRIRMYSSGDSFSLEMLP